jgi:perosamine synthetase
MTTIPVNAPLLGEREAELVAECIASGWVSSSGSYIEEFERRWASVCNRKHGIAVSNGTTALQLAVSVLDLEPGSEILMPSFTIISCALAAIYEGCVPVLVDSDPRTWCMDTDQIESRITERTRAIMPVHIYGHPVQMDAVLDIAERHGLRVIEDAAEAHGAGYERRSGTDDASWVTCGGMGDVSTFSFYANKLVTTGEGGMVVTNDDGLADSARSKRNLSFQAGRRFFHEDAGYNFRLTNLQAALGVAQLERFDQIVAKKRADARKYLDLLGDLEGVQLPPSEAWARSVYWMFGIVLGDDVALDATELAERLAAEGVETRPFFLGLHEQPALHDRGLFDGEKHPVAERLARRGLYLPSGLALTDDDIERVSETLHKVLAT